MFYLQRLPWQNRAFLVLKVFPHLLQGNDRHSRCDSIWFFIFLESLVPVLPQTLQPNVPSLFLTKYSLIFSSRASIDVESPKSRLVIMLECSSFGLIKAL